MDLKQYQLRLDAATTKQELYSLAGELNNFSEHINVDKVTCLGFMDLAKGKQHIQYMIDLSTEKRSKKRGGAQ